MKLVDAKESGTFTGRAELTLDLQSMQVNGRSGRDEHADRFARQRFARRADGQGAGGGAVVGAVIGAMFGGGKGAAIGAAAGGAAGAGTQVITKGQRRSASRRKRA